ncbi:MAG: hypothetical protein AAF198_02010 [Pseudomonadota bacterium]
MRHPGQDAPEPDAFCAALFTKTSKFKSAILARSSALVMSNLNAVADTPSSA